MTDDDALYRALHDQLDASTPTGAPISTPNLADLPEPWITEAGRRTVVPDTWADMHEPLEAPSRTFRRGLWADADAYVEIWSEANTMVGVIAPVTIELDVYLRPAAGFSSETLAHSAAQAISQQQASDRAEFAKLARRYARRV
jgi:hypothetical protein